MSSRPPSLRLLLLSTLLLIWQCARVQSSYIIDTVGLTILPKSTVQTGTTVVIHCQAIISRSNNSRLQYHFQITRNDLPIYSLDTKEDNVEYELSQARAADSGSYECRVTVKDRSKASNTHKLEVTGLQTPTLNLSNTQPYENEEFTATCRAPEEKGNIIFRFYRRFRSGEPERIKSVPANGNSVATTLRFQLRGECFLSCDYEVTLVSGSRRSNSSKEIQMNFKALSIVPVINMVPSHIVYEGDVVEVVCKVVDSPLRNIELFLTKERKILKQVTATALSHRFTTQDGDSGELVCKAAWENVHKESYLNITVKELFSKPHLTLKPVVDLFEGTIFTLNCSVSINEPNKITMESLKFSIYKDDVKLTSSKIYTTRAHPSKNGNYTCKVLADSLNHNIVKESQKLVVTIKVPVSNPVLSVVGGTMLLGKWFQVLCQSDRGTLPITYTLHGPNRLPESRTVSRPEEKAIFNTSAIFKSTDLSKFLCHANNAQFRPSTTGSGQQMLHTTNIIEPVSKPVLSVLPGMEEISEGNSMSLVCSVERGSPPFNFTWYQIGKEGFIASLATNKREGSHRINTVRRKDQGSYYCMITNPSEEIKHSSTVTITVKLAGWKKGLIAVFCILLILTLILVIAFKTRLLHWRRKTTGRLSVKSAGTKVERLSLTQAEVNEAANATPGMIGKSVWSDHVSGSESDDQSSGITAEKPEPQYTEVQTREADPNRAPVKKGTETVYSEVRNSQQGVPESADGQVTVEYAQLNHDQPSEQLPSNHGDNSPNGDHVTEINDSVCINTGDQAEGNCD